MSIQILPTTTVAELAKMLEANSARDVECYIRIESIRGKPVGYIVREPRIPAQSPFAIMRRQAE